MNKQSILFPILFLLSLQVYGQKGWEVGSWIGVSNYFGDLNTSFDFIEIGPAAGLIGRYNWNNRISSKMSLNYTFVYGDDADSPNSFERRRNLRFRSDIVDFTGQMEFNFFPYIHGTQDYYFTPYLLGGVNILYFNPSTEYEGERYNLRPLGTEGQLVGEEYNIISGGLVAGGGFKWDLNREWSFNIEIAVKRLFTDYLDDVSKTYPNPTSLRAIRGDVAAELSDRSEGEKIGELGRQRGNSRDNDTYTMLGFGMVYYFGRLECPDIGSKSQW
ncbi:type IX secretion system protein PorG [Portibacter marinus]|uniref:type IX secretion system protein PorG n=1 Tax=Portibacter marinus TaxID=2898660 RepID=UPI001F378B43|nr:DUF6089 family protein [Portibacter marinus]